jgi:hypothetical protein
MRRPPLPDSAQCADAAFFDTGMTDREMALPRCTNACPASAAAKQIFSRQMEAEHR